MGVYEEVKREDFDVVLFATESKVELLEEIRDKVETTGVMMAILEGGLEDIEGFFGILIGVEMGMKEDFATLAEA